MKAGVHYDARTWKAARLCGHCVTAGRQPSCVLMTPPHVPLFSSFGGGAIGAVIAARPQHTLSLTVILACLSRRHPVFPGGIIDSQN